jgi:hypothetical protein
MNPKQTTTWLDPQWNFERTSALEGYIYIFPDDCSDRLLSRQHVGPGATPAVWDWWRHCVRRDAQTLCALQLATWQGPGWHRETASLLWGRCGGRRRKRRRQEELTQNIETLAWLVWTWSFHFPIFHCFFSRACAFSMWSLGKIVGV